MMRYQRGQALPLGLAVALVGVLAAFVLYNTGRTATDKARLANAADAAAYSGLLWQARALNFQAYTNRAMVANQVSIAQAVSLRSWSSYGAHTSRNLAALLAGIPYINAFAKGVETMMTALESVIGPVSQGMVTVIDLINRGVAVSQQAMFSSSFVATPEIVDEVVRLSDARFESRTLYSLAGLQGNLADWNDFTRTYERDEAEPMAARTALVNGSLDTFSRERDWELFESFWLYSSPVTRHRLYRRGGTRLVRRDGPSGPRWEWVAKDTLSLHNRVWAVLKEKKEEIPVGWGMAFANDGSSGGRSLLGQGCRARDPSVAADCGYWSDNRRAERAAVAEREAMSGYSGLNAFRSLSEAALDHEREDPILRLRTEVALDLSDVATTEDLLASETFETAMAAPGDRLSSISIAEVYYRRPDEGFGDALSAESANGYNAYWTVRLAPIPDRERLLAIGLRGGGSGVAPDGGLGAMADRVDTMVAGLDPGGAARDAVADLDPSGAVSGGLPDYAAALARGYAEGASVDVAGLEASVAAVREIGDLDIEGFVRELDPVGAIKDELEDQLESAVRDIMNGWVSDAKNRALGAANDLIDNEEVEQAIEDAEEFVDKIEATREYVATHIEPHVGRIADAMGARRATLNATIAEKERLKSGVGANKEELEGSIRRAKGQLKDLRKTYAQRLATKFREIVLEADPEWDVPNRMALEIAKGMLDAYFAELAGEEPPEEDPLPWDSDPESADGADDEDDDNDEDETDE